MDPALDNINRRLNYLTGDLVPRAGKKLSGPFKTLVAELEQRVWAFNTVHKGPVPPNKQWVLALFSTELDAYTNHVNGVLGVQSTPPRKLQRFLAAQKVPSVLLYSAGAFVSGSAVGAVVGLITRKGANDG